MSSPFAETQPSDSELEISNNGWNSVTWEEIEEWAGSRNVVRGRSYQRRGHVRELILTAEGRLMATVVGNDKYQVSVWRNADRTGGDSLQSPCTCPVGHNHCKHAVAVIAEYFKSLADDSSALSGSEHHQHGEDDEEDSDVIRIVPTAKSIAPIPDSAVEPPRPVDGVRPQASSWDGSLKDNLRAKSHEELVELVASLLQRFSELRADVRDRLGDSKQPPSN